MTDNDTLPCGHPSACARGDGCGWCAALRAERAKALREAAASAESEPLPGEPTAEEAAAVAQADRRMLVYGTVRATVKSIAARLRRLADDAERRTP